MKSVRIEAVRKTFGSTVALDDVSLDIGEGEIFFLLGPSGCGKTTLLRIIAGLTPPSSGKILIGGDDVTAQPPHLRRTAMVFQNYALWPHLTVAENVRFAMTVKRTGRAEMAKRTREALAIVHMEKHTGRKPAQLSGGEQQRVALARAIAADPGCLLLDEPLSNLDANLRVEMRSEIRRICKQTGLTTIYVTHDQKESLSIADRIAVLRAGKVEQVAPPAELYARPATTFVAGFVGETNFIRGTVERVDDGAAEVRAGEVLLSGKVAAASLRPSSRAVCSVRPEKLKLGGAEGGSNEIRAVIRRVVFLGELTQIEVEAGETLRLKVLETTPRTLRQEGETVLVRCDPADVSIYEDDDEQA
jgi:iron(III) transport system ATP-binding protein